MVWGNYIKEPQNPVLFSKASTVHCLEVFLYEASLKRSMSWSFLWSPDLHRSAQEFERLLGTPRDGELHCVAIVTLLCIARGRKSARFVIYFPEPKNKGLRV